MAVIDKYANLNRAFTAARHIKTMCDDLKAFAGNIPFNNLEGRLDSMRESYANGVGPLLAAVNPLV